MSTVIAMLTFLPLLVVALAHLFWALGTTWPINSEALLAHPMQPDRARESQRMAGSRLFFRGRHHGDVVR